MKYKRVYEMLKCLGHSPLKAAEIIVDAERGDKHALQWIRIGHKQQRNLSTEYKCPKCGAQADERWACCEVK